jgi:hypothetical protein
MTLFQNSNGKIGKDKAILIAAIVLGLIAAGANLMFLRSATGSRYNILVAKSDYPAGAAIEREMFDVVTMYGKRDQIKSTFIDADDFEVYEKKTLAEPLKAHEALTLHSFSMAAPIEVPPGKTAVSINVHDESSGLSYLIRPGDNVNIWGPLNGSEQRLVENACIKAIGDISYQPEQSESRKVSYRSVTILVNNGDMQALLTNLDLAGDNVRLGKTGNCNPSVETTVTPAAAVTPDKQDELLRSVSARAGKKR